MNTHGLFIATLLCVFISGCSILETPSNRAEAISKIKIGTIVQYDKATQSVGFLDMKPNSTKFLNAKSACEGAVGSVIPPLALEGCTTGLVNSIFLPLKKLAEALPGPGNNPYQHEVSLANAEHYWRKQEEENDCWAASLESARDFLHLRHKSQKQIVALAAQECPSMRDASSGSSKRADAYQIVYAIAMLQSMLDRERIKPHFCDDEKCVIVALGNQRPVIMLKSGHAFLLTSVSYVYVPPEAYAQDPVLSRIHISIGGKDVAQSTKPAIDYAYALDPLSGKETPIKLTPFDLCAADVFIAL